MSILLLWLAAWTPSQVMLDEARVDAVRAVERARTAASAVSTVALDEGSLRAIAARRVARELREQAVLAERFGTRVSPEMLSAEFDRIERQSQDPEQWEAIKRALENDRRQIEEAACRPLVVQRLLRQRFAFDEAIHADAHARARQARGNFIDGRPVEGIKTMRLSRLPASLPDTRTLLAEAKARAKEPHVLSSPEDASKSPAAELVSLHPEAVRALEAQLRKPGDVSTILSDPDRFSVYRLIERTEEAWTVEAAIFPKRDFESWFREAAALSP